MDLAHHPTYKKPDKGQLGRTSALTSMIVLNRFFSGSIHSLNLFAQVSLGVLAIPLS